MHESHFFIITALGFESDTLKEIQFFLSSQGVVYKAEVQKGGIDLVCPLEHGLLLNRVLKLATRILLRIETEFPVYHFNELEKKLKKISLARYFPEKQEVLVKVDSKKSKLGQEKRIFQVFQQVYASKYKLVSKPSEASTEAMLLYVDIFKDNCRLSVDTSGEPLYKRTQNKYNAEAPMRETIAHWGLNRMLDEVSPWEKPFIFVDPFCGSGTLIKEALTFFSSNERSFAFQKAFPKIKTSEILKNKEEQKLPFSAYVAQDISQEALDVCQKNLKSFLSAEKIEFILGDSLKMKLKADRDSFIIANLPYGKRIQDQLPKTLVEDLIINFKPRIMGLFHPEKWTHKNAKKMIHHPVENGGLKLYFSILIF